METNSIEHKILNSSKRLAEANDITFDKTTEMLILNAIHEYELRITKPIILLRLPIMETKKDYFENSIQQIKDYVKHDYYLLSYWDNRCDKLEVEIIGNIKITETQEDLLRKIQTFINYE